MEQTKTLYQQIRKLMSTDKFIIVMNVVRILLVVWAIFITIYLVKEVEAVKMLAYDPCALCMNKTGAMCFLPPGA